MKHTINTKSIIAILMVAVMCLSLFACNKDKVDEEKHIYENRYVNQRYYYSQGYPDDWTLTFGQDDFALATLNVNNGSQSGYLCAKFFPLNDTSDVSFTIYKYDTTSMMNTLNGISARLTNSSSDYYLNDVFVDGDNIRDSFTFTSDIESENPNHFQFHTANYKFVRDGEDWRGKFYVSTANSTWFFLVCMEATEAKWDAAYEVFSLMIQDFGFEGFEASK